jgi:hypothetical protein
MLKIFNNIWVILISCFVLYLIINKIINMNKPFDVENFIQKYENQEKIKNKLSLNNFKSGLSTIASYYIGV